MTAPLPPHGTPGRYNLGCREECCRRAHRLRKNLWRLGRADALIDGTGTRRRIQALRAIGWSNHEISTAAGITETSLAGLLQTARSTTRVRTSTATAIRSAYDQLSMSRGSASVQTLGIAVRRGWAPPLAWDDDTIDDPAAAPAGVRSLEPVRHLGRGSTSAVDPDEVLELVDLGEPAAAIARRFKVKPASLQKILSRAGRDDVWLRVSEAERERREHARAA